MRRLLVRRDTLRHTCLLQMRDGQLAQALRTARQCYDLSADASSARLLAVACLVNEDFPGALDAHDQSDAAAST